MSSANLLNSEKLLNTAVTGNGTTRLWESARINPSNADNAVEVTIKYVANLPDPEQGGTNYRLSALLEREDEVGNWFPFHYQFDAFVKAEYGNTHILRLNPTVFNLDEGVSNAMSDGFNVIALESLKQGTLPDNFRIVILVNENGFGTLGAFQEVDVTVSFVTRAV